MGVGVSGGVGGGGNKRKAQVHVDFKLPYNEYH